MIVNNRTHEDLINDGCVIVFFAFFPFFFTVLLLFTLGTTVETSPCAGKSFVHARWVGHWYIMDIS